MRNLSEMLGAVARGEKQAGADLLEEVYDSLRRLAAQKLARERPGQTLQPTDLVHEAWLRLTKEGDPGWDGRHHFFGAAAEAMRRILVDRARRKQCQRHGGGLRRTDFNNLQAAIAEDGDTVLLVDEALEKLKGHDAVAAELIKLRFFGGLSHREAAEILSLSEGSAKRKWAYARAWLYEELHGAE